MSIRTILDCAAGALKSVCERPRFEAELLLSHHLGCERTYLTAHPEAKVNDEEGFWKLVRRRAAYEPYEYIVGKASFYDITLAVAPGVLIPRPETELLVDKAAEIIATRKIDRLIEVGVGSGAISIVLARKFPRLRIVATDISAEALNIAKRNIARYGLDDRIELVRTDLLAGIADAPLVVSNPPYIAKEARLERNVKDYEPPQALFGGERGDEVLKRLIDEVHTRCIPYLACEMGYDQKASIATYVAQKGEYDVTFYSDLAGFDRGFVMSVRS